MYQLGVNVNINTDTRQEGGFCLDKQISRYWESTVLCHVMIQWRGEVIVSCFILWLNIKYSMKKIFCTQKYFRYLQYQQLSTHHYYVSSWSSKICNSKIVYTLNRHNMHTYNISWYTGAVISFLEDFLKYENPHFFAYIVFRY